MAAEISLLENMDVQFLRGNLNPIMYGGGVFRTPSNFVASVDPLKVIYIEMFYGDFSYLSIW